MNMSKKASIYSALVLIVVAGLFVGGYRLIARRSQTQCGFCQRHINPKAHVVAEVGGRRRDVCCTHCAVTEALQEKKSLRLVQVTDFPTGKMVNPETAWFVEDSRVIACEHDMSKMDESKHMTAMGFDRCSPGTFAFSDRKAAEAFVAENGGVLRNLTAVMAEAQQP
jgi:nitrous oxide reductase accessory protein NosL